MNMKNISTDERGNYFSGQQLQHPQKRRRASGLVTSLVAILGLLLASGSASALGIGVGSITTNTGDASSTTFSHTVESELNMMLIVTAVHGAGDTPVTGATYGGQPMTLIGDTGSDSGGDDDPRVSAFYLLNPLSGSNSVAVNWGTGGEYSVGVVALWDVDVDNPDVIDNIVISLGNSATAGGTVTPQPGFLVMDVFGTANDIDDGATPANPQNELWLLGGDGDGEMHGASWLAAITDDPINMSWSIGGGGGEWAHITWTVANIPEPASLMVIGLASMIALARRRQRCRIPGGDQA
jgi:hypothetical protein